MKSKSISFVLEMTDRVSELISIFRSQFQNRRFDQGTLRILHSILPCEHAYRQSEIRDDLIEFIRSEAKLVVEDEIADKSVEEKLLVLQFLVRALALSGDVRSCLALRYEALIMRDRECANLDWLQVEYNEWLAFAKDSLQNGYHAIAVQVCENALKSVQQQINHRSDSYNVVVDEIKDLKDVAVALVASHSVQAQATKYLNNKKRKEIQQNRKLEPESKNSQASASSVFRDGIKRRNRHQLVRLQSSTTTTTPNSSVCL